MKRTSSPLQAEQQRCRPAVSTERHGCLVMLKCVVGLRPVKTAANDKPYLPGQQQYELDRDSPAAGRSCCMIRSDLSNISPWG